MSGTPFFYPNNQFDDAVLIVWRAWQSHPPKVIVSSSTFYVRAPHHSAMAFMFQLVPA